jgi:hypothetical protein
MSEPEIVEEGPEEIFGEWCIDCGEDFRYDDCGGYNPPCICGAHCRSCHEAEEREAEEGFDDYAEEAEKEIPCHLQEKAP